MRGHGARAARILLLPTVLLAVAALAGPTRIQLWIHIWLLTVLVLAALEALAALRRALPRRPSLFAHRAPAEVAIDPFPSLQRLEREVTLAAASAYDAHFRLRPTLREAAAELLAARRGVDLDRDGERARAVLGDETWELVRPDRPPPAAPRAEGLDRPTLERIVVALETI